MGTMKKTLCYVLLAILGLEMPARAVPLENRRFTPYFHMNMAQGAYLPDKGDFFTGAHVGINVGLLSQIAKDHAVFGLYGLNFAGQAFRFPDTQEFASKSLSHMLNLEYRWQVSDRWRLRPGIGIGKNLTQTAAGEIWGEGLYDDSSKGGQLAADYGFGLLGKPSTLTGQWAFRSVEFPNYTDIIREFQGADANTELAGGLKDQTFQEWSLMLRRNPAFFRFLYSVVDFKNERVVEPSGTYGSTKQRDSNVGFSAGAETRLWIFEAVPEVSYLVHDSNQNFLLFQSPTDSAPVFAGGYYDYTQTTLSLPLFINLTPHWALSAGLEYDLRRYAHRQPRNAENRFKGGRQTNNMLTLSAGLRKKLNAVSALSLTYGVVTASSNNKFERYLPYNYTGQSLSLGYHLTY
jgi:hypothetical protein